MNKHYQLSSTFFLLPVLFLVFIQLAAAVLSTTKVSFPVLLTLSAVAAFALSYFITRTITTSFFVTGRQVTIAGGLTLLSSILFLYRINWHIFDLLCPTGVLGLVTQVSNGKFPASYLSFPDFPMNYHQGFIFVTGTISYLTGLLPAISIKVSMLVLFAALNIGIALFLLSLQNRYYFLPSLLFIFGSSISTKFYVGIDSGWYNYLNIFEYSSSNSWPLAFILLVAFLFFLKQYTHTATNILIGSLLILSAATINATLFSVMTLSVAGLFAYYVYCYRTIPYRHLTLSLACLLIIFIIPRFITSAFLVGTQYASPQTAIRILSIEPYLYLKNMVRFVLLCGPVVFLGLWLGLTSVRRKVYDWRSWLVVTLAISFAFPFVFTFTNIDLWDNLHKFTLINIFVAIVIIVVFLPENYLPKRFIYCYLVVAAILSLPALYNIATTRMVSSFTDYMYAAPGTEDVVRYLENKNSRIVPYKRDFGDMCDLGGYGDVALRTGSSLSDTYFPNFLLSEKIEADYLQHTAWTESTSTIISTIEGLNKDSIMLVHKKYGQEFLWMVEHTKPESRRKIVIFNNFLVYE